MLIQHKENVSLKIEKPASNHPDYAGLILTSNVTSLKTVTQC